MHVAELIPELPVLSLTGHAPATTADSQSSAAMPGGWHHSLSGDPISVCGDS